MIISPYRRTFDLRDLNWLICLISEILPKPAARRLCHRHRYRSAFQKREWVIVWRLQMYIMCVVSPRWAVSINPYLRHKQVNSPGRWLFSSLVNGPYWQHLMRMNSLPRDAVHTNSKSTPFVSAHSSRLFNWRSLCGETMMHAVLKYIMRIQLRLLRGFSLPRFFPRCLGCASF